jgi:RecA-family ATPase
MTLHVFPGSRSEAIVRASIAAIQRENGLDYESARLLYDYRGGWGGCTYLSTDQEEFCKALERRLAREKADRIMNRRNGNAEKRQRQGEAPASSPSTAEAVQPEPLPFIDMSRWDDEPVPVREWAVLDRIPVRQPTLFSGEGAIGKTLIALQLSVATVLARDWFGTMPAPGQAIYLGAEDEAAEIHRRLADINAHYGSHFADLVGHLHLLSYAGQDATLGIAGRDGIVKPTTLFERLYQAALIIKPKLITLDTVSDVFVGNENDRAQVRQFVALLRRLAIDANSGLIVCSHPSLTGISTGTGLSGSTGWHNSVRARMYLRPAKTPEGDEPDPELRELQFLKNNYGPVAERILLRWKNGVFIPEPGTGSLERAAAEAKADSMFLTILGRFHREGRNASDTKGPTHAPTLFAQEQEAKAAKMNKSTLADAMRRLFAANRIHRESYRRNSQDHFRLAPGPKP